MNASLIRPFTCFAALALGTSVVSASGKEWNQFRGPGGSASAQAKGLPTVPTMKDMAWSVSLPGKGHSSPVSWGSLIFITAESEQTPGKRFVLAIEAQTGAEKWRYEDTFESYSQHKDNSYAASTPTVDAERLYLTWLSGGSLKVLALTHEGKKSWEKTIGHYKEDHGGPASPILAGSLLIVPNDHGDKTDAGLYALDTKTGETKWKYTTQTPKTAFSTPLLLNGPDGKEQLIISSNPVALTGLDPASGKELWHYDREVPGSRAVGSPVAVDGLVFASVGQGGNGQGAVIVKPGSSDGKQKPELVWEASKRIPYVPTPVAIGKKLYCLNDAGLLSCLDPKTGKADWEERATTPCYGSPVAINDHLYAINRKGDLLVVKANDKAFEKVGELPLGEQCHSTPAIVGDRLIIRTATKLMAFGGGSAVRP